MFLGRTKRLALALIAQVTLCLAIAPVIAAQQSWEQEALTPGQTRSHDGPTIQAARDAVNTRPEDESESRRKASKTRTASNNRGRLLLLQLLLSTPREVLADDSDRKCVAHAVTRSATVRTPARVPSMRESQTACGGISLRPLPRSTFAADLDRGCRYAQSPANCCEPSGFMRPLPALAQTLCAGNVQPTGPPIV